MLNPSVADIPQFVEDAPCDCEPTPADWQWLCESTRPVALDPPAARAAYLPLAHWLECQCGLYRSLSRTEDDVCDLVHTVLNDLLCVARSTKSHGAAELVGRPGTRYRGLDLAAVGLPDEPRNSRVADLLVEHAQYYLDLETDLGRLAAWAILQHSEGAEWFGSQTIGDYWDDEAASRAALDTMAGEHGDGYPLW